MSHQHTPEQQEGLRAYLRARVSRTQLLAMAGAGVAAAVVPHIADAQTTAGTTESPSDILNIRDTFEHFGIALLTAVIGNASQLMLTANGGLLLAVVQAALAEEVYHADFLESQGGKTLSDTFTIPPTLLTDPVALFTALEMEETLEISAGTSAVRQFSQMGNATLAQNFYQLEGTEAEHRVLARGALALLGAGGVPPNNKGFEQDFTFYLADALAIFKSRGLLGGSGMQITFPGRAAALAAAAPMVPNVLQQTP